MIYRSGARWTGNINQCDARSSHLDTGVGSDPAQASSSPKAIGSTTPLPSSIAIAGIHGYMGRLIYDAAVQLEVPIIYGFDPGPRPADFACSSTLRMIASERQFCELDADLFHIATHPDQRQAVYRLLERGRCVNIEKPMAHPAFPDECDRLRKAARGSAGSVLFDFVEAFNPCTLQVRALLSRFRQHKDFRIDHIRCVRAKDREDRRNPRNRKVIVPIQFQETAHCLAMLLLVLDRPASFAEAFPDGVTIEALSAPYNPPNPEDYPVRDGRRKGHGRDPRRRLDDQPRHRLQAAGRHALQVLRNRRASQLAAISRSRRSTMASVNVCCSMARLTPCWAS